MNLVIIESPYAGDTEGNLKYLRECVKDSLNRGEAPFASHGFYTHYLNDAIPEDRRAGISAGFSWMECADLVAVYSDLGISPGMQKGIEQASLYGKQVEFRKIR